MPTTDEGQLHDPLPFELELTIHIELPTASETPGEWVISSNWLSPERSKRWGRKYCGPEALCRLLDQWPVSAGFHLMMLEPVPALLTAILTTDIHTQETEFWKDQIIASFCSMWWVFFKGVHLAFCVHRISS